MLLHLYTSLLLLGHALAPASLLSAAPAGPGRQYGAPRPVAALAGQVLNEAGAPLPGVVIVVQGLPSMASTNSDGRFLVPAPGEDPVLVFSCSGYRAQTVVAPAAGPLAVTMYALTGSGSDAGTSATGATVSAGGSARAAALAFAEVLPTFTGGDAAYHAYLRQNAHYPARALEDNLAGAVYVGFVVDEQGRICDAEVVKGCGHGFDEEALRLVRLMPWWQPGRQAGTPVRVARTLRIVFKAQLQ
ncbi:TonB family protein [Hymenobacter nivis]|uniref:TonB family protein n=1 Tax=Hymenobacter nivis TaxID=1850093 RepID=A0A502H1Z3_9BACT|nr:TonB family protein [Hymenobacter nivis]TPG67386.1 TonB family protein [Hymenobacter nivis]